MNTFHENIHSCNALYSIQLGFMYVSWICIESVCTLYLIFTNLFIETHAGLHVSETSVRVSLMSVFSWEFRLMSHSVILCSAAVWMGEGNSLTAPPCGYIIYHICLHLLLYLHHVSLIYSNNYYTKYKFSFIDQIYIYIQWDIYFPPYYITVCMCVCVIFFFNAVWGEYC